MARLFRDTPLPGRGFGLSPLAEAGEGPRDHGTPGAARPSGIARRLQAETGIRLPFALEPFSDLDEDVRQSIARVRVNPFIPHRNAVRGFVYDVRTGRLREVK